MTARFSHPSLAAVILACLGAVLTAKGSPSEEPSWPVTPRIRVIIDNDFGGDPDGLFQLAHHLLSPSVEIRAVIGSIHHTEGFYGYPGTASHSCEMARDLLRVMARDQPPPVFEGGGTAMKDPSAPVPSEGAAFIVKEAMREDTKLPLVVVCGAGLTDIASACLMEPKIARRLRLVWIGGPEYPGQAVPPPGAGRIEYNMSIDLMAARMVFNRSDIPLWQVPRNAYRQALVSRAELTDKIGGKGEPGDFLMGRLDDLIRRAHGSLGEAYVLGDSPLVLLTALESSWEQDPSSSGYVSLPCPEISDQGSYVENSKGRPIRVYTSLDTRLMFGDFFAKMALLKNGK